MNNSPPKKDFKTYPHFDAPMSEQRFEQLVNSPEQIAKHPFYPFIVFDQARPSIKTRISGVGQKDPRPIRYASHRDAAIFTHYRKILSEFYEKALIEKDIDECVLAYRKIPKFASRNGNKSSVDFAKDAFDCIKEFGDCVVIAVDISSFFENLDHARIKRCWKKLLGTDELPDDHFNVFKAITKYGFCMRNEVYSRLGYSESYKDKNGKVRYKHCTEFKDIPTKLCSPEEFRSKIAGADTSQPSIINKNENIYGLPQGASLSDVLANAYFLDFDYRLKQYATSFGGVYRRYSDDMLFILPDTNVCTKRIVDRVQSELQREGAQLQLSVKKTVLYQFFQTNSGLECQPIGNTPDTQGFEYLGIRFDGNAIWIRNSTISRLKRKVAFTCKAVARNYVKRYPNKSLKWLKENIDTGRIMQQFGKLSCSELDSEKPQRTFRSYAIKVEKTFVDYDCRCFFQLRNQKQQIRTEVNRSIEREYFRSQPPPKKVA